MPWHDSSYILIQQRKLENGGGQNENLYKLPALPERLSQNVLKKILKGGKNEKEFQIFYSTVLLITGFSFIGICNTLDGRLDAVHNVLSAVFKGPHRL
jgi:hypothetical protein